MAGSPHTVSATYNPDTSSNFTTSTGTLTDGQTVNKATPTVSVSDAGGTSNGMAFPAKATVAGVIAGIDDTPAASLEGVRPSLTYYAGSTASGTLLSAAPSVAGTYTVVANFAGSADYTSGSDMITFDVAPSGDVGLDSANIVYSTNNSSSTINFAYHTVNNPGSFTAGLYQSPDPTFNIFRDTLLQSQTVTQAANSSGKGAFTLTFTPQPSKPYLLVVVNPTTFIPQSNGNLHELPAYLVSVAQIQAIMIKPALPLTDAQQYIGPLNEAMEEFQIDTPKREASFLAQIKVESASLTLWKEAGQADVDAKGNPNLKQGRGPIQLTNELKYEQFYMSFYSSKPIIKGKSKIYWYDTAYFEASLKFGMDFIHNPGLLADESQPVLNFRVAGWFWTVYKASKNLSVKADGLAITNPSNPGFDSATAAVNFTISKAVNGINPKTGKPNGLEPRLAAYRLALKVLFGYIS